MNGLKMTKCYTGKIGRSSLTLAIFGRNKEFWIANKCFKYNCANTFNLVFHSCLSIHLFIYSFTHSFIYLFTYFFNLFFYFWGLVGFSLRVQSEEISLIWLDFLRLAKFQRDLNLLILKVSCISHYILKLKIQH